MHRISSLRLAVPVILFFGLFVTGCQESAPPKSITATTTTVQANISSADETPAADRPQVTVQVGSWSDVQRMVAAHRGKVVVLDVWSTWCEPCVREFPNLVRLHRQYAEDVACISLNIDYIGVPAEPPDSFRDKVLEFARQHEAMFENVISSDPDEEVLKALDAFTVPVVQVYDRDGNLRETFTNDDDQYGDQGFTYEEHVIPLVQALRKG